MNPENIPEPEKEELDWDEMLASKKISFDMKSMKDAHISWWTRMLLRFAPQRGIIHLARELGAEIDSEHASRANALFSKVDRIDILPSDSGLRGFRLILDQNTCLYFEQDGDHFVYDGFEAGEYDRGDITVFDKK